MQQRANSKEKEVKNDGIYFQDELSKLLNCNYYKTLKDNLPKPSGYPGWSPNNVRRVIISPDGILIQYHTTVKAKLPSNRLVHIRLFNVEEAMQALNSGKCKPMLQVLGKNRVYSAIEEIILLSKSDNGLYLLNSELNLQSIGLDNRGALGESLKARYSRMYGVSVVNNLSLKEFVDKYQGMLSKKNTSIIGYMRSENESMKTLIVGGKKAFGYMPNLQRFSITNNSGYVLDSEVLGEYFRSISDEYKESEKQVRKQEKTIDVSNECIQEINFYIKVLSLLGNSLSRGNARPTVRKSLSDYDNKEASVYLQKGLSVYDITSEVKLGDKEMGTPTNLYKTAKSVVCWLFKCNSENLRYFSGYKQLNTFLKICVYFNMLEILEMAKSTIPKTYETAVDCLRGTKFILDERGILEEAPQSYNKYMVVYGKYATLFKDFWVHGGSSAKTLDYDINNITVGMYLIEKIFTKRIKKAEYGIYECKERIRNLMK